MYRVKCFTVSWAILVYDRFDTCGSLIDLCVQGKPILVMLGNLLWFPRGVPQAGARVLSVCNASGSWRIMSCFRDGPGAEYKENRRGFVGQARLLCCEAERVRNPQPSSRCPGALALVTPPLSGMDSCTMSYLPVYFEGRLRYLARFYDADQYFWRDASHVWHGSIIPTIPTSIWRGACGVRT